VWVEGDAVRLEQVITNLLVNAVKYTPPGGRIEIRVTSEQGQAVLTVEDTGAGITPALRAQVFDLFVQGERGLDRAQGGLGIGLTLVRRIVELHGGTVDVASAGTGKGSTFVVRLPAGPMPAVAPSRSLAPVASSARRVLVIEDNDDAREALRLALELEGHDVLEAEDGPRGIDLALGKRPHLALIDVGLPGIDGYEVARRLRAVAGERRAYLVALTGYGQPDDRARALASGFDAFMVKPIDSDALRDVLKALPPSG